METYPDSRALSLAEAVQISKYPALGTLSCDCAFICDPEGWRDDEEPGRERIQITSHIDAPLSSRTSSQFHEIFLLHTLKTHRS